MERDDGRRRWRGRARQVGFALVAALALIGGALAQESSPRAQLLSVGELERWLAKDPTPTKQELGGYATPWCEALGSASLADRERLHDLLLLLLPPLERAGAKAEYLAWIEFKIGEAKTDLGRHDDARRWLADAAARARPGDVFLPWMLVLLADNERELGLWDDSDAHLASARALVGDANEPAAKALLGFWQRTRASLDIHLGLHERARAALDDAGRLASEIGDAVAARATLEGRMKLAYASDDYDGLREIEKAWPSISAAAGSSPEREKERECLLAAAYAEEERVALAPTRERLEELERLSARGDIPITWRVQLGLSAASHASFLGAHADARRMVAALDELLAASPASIADLPVYAAELSAMRMRIALDCPAPPPVAEERNAARERLEASFDAFLDVWSRAPVREGGIGFLHFTNRYVIASELVRAHLELSPRESRDGDALGVLLRIQALGSLARQLEAPVCTVERVLARAVPEGHVALAYLPGRFQSHAFVIEGGRVTAVPIEPIARIDALRRAAVRDLTRQLRARGGDDRTWQESLGALESALAPAGPIREALSRARSLEIVGGESLGYVPFEAFELGSSRALGERCTVSYLPSFAVGAALDRAAAARTHLRSITFVALPENDAAELERHGLAALPADSKVLEPLARGYGANVELFTAREATRLALEGAHSTVLHVITHGLYDASRELPAGLLLARTPDAPAELWTEDVARWRAPTLVVLSACGPWRAPLRRGDDGRGNLAGALLARGASAVVTSYVDQELATTLAWSRVFHDELTRGCSVAEALRAARVDEAERLRRGGLRHRTGATFVHAVGAAQSPLFSASAREPSDTSGEDRDAATSTSTHSALLIAAGAVVALAALLVLARSKMNAPGER